MDLFFGGDRTKYTFQLDQIPVNNYYDANSWENLRTISATDVSCDDDDYCTFRWEEIKKEGHNYIYMIPSIPYSSFTFFDNKIKIIHPGGFSAGAIVGIVFGCLAFAAIIIIIISCCCCKYNPRCNNCCLCCRCCGCCPCYHQMDYIGAYSRTVQVQPAVYPVPVAAPVPVVAPVPAPAPVYPPPQAGYPPSGYNQPAAYPYSSANFV